MKSLIKSKSIYHIIEDLIVIENSKKKILRVEKRGRKLFLHLRPGFFKVGK